MHITISKPTATMPPEALRSTLLRRKIQASEAVERLLADLAFGPPADGAWTFPTMRRVQAHG